MAAPDIRPLATPHGTARSPPPTRRVLLTLVLIALCHHILCLTPLPSLVMLALPESLLALSACNAHTEYCSASSVLQCPHVTLLCSHRILFSFFRITMPSCYPAVILIPIFRYRRKSGMV